MHSQRHEERNKRGSHQINKSKEWKKLRTRLGIRLIRYVAVRKASSQNLRGIEAWAKLRDQLLQYDDACAQQSHFVDEHEDMKHGA